jgi:protein phosphatase
LVLKIFAKSEKGLLRNSNQDRYYFECSRDEFSWVIVCDGMGGTNGGDVASSMAVDTIKEEMQKFKQNFDFKSFMAEIFKKTNKKIYEKSKNDTNLKGMGTTVVFGLIFKDRLQVVHAGDSRAYTITSDYNIKQITHDHSMVQEMLEQGKITSDQAKNHPQKNIITRSLGVSDDIDLDYTEVLLDKEDILLFCTDGLTNSLGNEKILDTVLNLPKDEFLASKLVECAKKSWGEDDVTVVFAFN